MFATMTVEFIMIAVVGSGVIATGAGVVRLWIKNGRDAKRRDIENAEEVARRDGILEANLKTIFIGQQEIRKDISVLREDINDQKNHCASVTSGFAEKIKGIEKTILNTKLRRP